MRVRAIATFVFSGAVLLFFSPYLVHKAATNQLSWLVPIIVIPISVAYFYRACKLFWSRIIGKRPTTLTHADNNAGR